MSELSVKELRQKAKEALVNYEWTDPRDPTKKLRWGQILPSEYAENSTRGHEPQYIAHIATEIEKVLAYIDHKRLTGDAARKKYDTFLASTLNNVFQKRYGKTMGMIEKERSKSVRKTTGVAAEGTGTTGAEGTGTTDVKKPRAKRRTDEEKKENLKRELAKLEEKDAEGKKVNEIAAAIAGINISKLTKHQLGHYRGRSRSVLRVKENISPSNARALNMTVRAESRARSASKKAAASTGSNNAASVSTTRSSTRKRMDGMTMEELCALKDKLKKSNNSPITLNDVYAYIKKKNAQKKSFSELAAANVNEE